MPGLGEALKGIAPQGFAAHPSGNPFGFAQRSLTASKKGNFNPYPACSAALNAREHDRSVRREPRGSQKPQSRPAEAISPVRGG